MALSAFATEGVRPDLVVLLDLDPAVARARREERTGVPDKLEAEAGDFHERVRATFLGRAKQDPERYLVIDADQGPQILTGAIQDRLDQLLPLSAAEAEAAARRAAALAAAIAKEREFQAAKAAERGRGPGRARSAAERPGARSSWRSVRRPSRSGCARRPRPRPRGRRRSARPGSGPRPRRPSGPRSRKREAERREQESRVQTQQDALRRREAELTVRQAEARAKERARLAAAAAKVAQDQARRQPSLTDDLMQLGGVSRTRAGSGPGESPVENLDREPR